MMGDLAKTTRYWIVPRVPLQAGKQGKGVLHQVLIAFRRGHIASAVGVPVVPASDLLSSCDRPGKGLHDPIGRYQDHMRVPCWTAWPQRLMISRDKMCRHFLDYFPHRRQMYMQWRYQISMQTGKRPNYHLFTMIFRRFYQYWMLLSFLSSMIDRRAMDQMKAPAFPLPFSSNFPVTGCYSRS